MLTAAHRARSSGEALFGTVLSVGSPALTEAALSSGFDFIVLDCEHGTLDERALLASLHAISASEAFALVRVRPRDLHAVSRYLDDGAQGILMPDVRSAVEARAFVAAATRRGTVGPPLLLAMIEGAEAVACVDDIAATPGLDGLFIGPRDLAADLGTPGEFLGASYQTAFARIEQAAKQQRLLLGTRTHRGFSVERLLRSGHSLIVVSADVAALRDGYRVHLEAARALQTPPTPW